MKRFISIFIPVIMLMTVSSCNHKLLDEDEQQRVRVVFDWRYAPDANPASVSAHFFRPGHRQLKYEFAGRDGDYIRIDREEFMAVGMNSDHTDWANFRGEDDIETFEIYTDNTDVLPHSGVPTSRLPRARGTEDERMANPPGMLWNNRQNDIKLNIPKKEHVVTFYPEEVVCYYTVTIINVENLSYLVSGTLDASLSGMAEGFYHGAHAPTDNPVTFTFTLGTTDTPGTIYGEFLTFGECSRTTFPHFLSVYVVHGDGTATHFSFDVADQVSQAPDPRHVDIVIEGFKIPKPEIEDGLAVDLENWETVDNEIIM